ncbi:MAG: 30S ribosomal protein S3 [Parcubacteria group bacterium GW2011_GWB1_45_7]|uniref:Small ribosomal subunit protein uS3 n=5 Tax=root TaxID=1 RepID=A0A0H4TC54_9BACT|nr:30S ribosomal protein S3 [uncultured organism]AKQ02473.1 30S ribosomal protein S3, small subunit ribosomal protein S3 [uncultured Parcubacteria bacterium Rifle_16ft_4_minimus_37647]AKQ05586.1 30S ribosomal protein S3, small subunit ribosomal protein S3 [uncultured Parcubacteria bacterium Rifle_16ft_4_minimus_23790]KKU11942.1 MAG: 30S ribosomal protein S3 [Parcubacteria group bacterium GW2011_GWB1_45_7]OGY58602.1 MAG: 30S ribosomal protein S3 [Candidatus Colwellbacteria bacterium RIFCSPHIGHO2
MGRKINPTTYRLGINRAWRSRWMPPGNKFGNWLKEDEAVRNTVMEKVKKAGIADIEIERTSGQYRVVIKASRPGLIIGRGGEGVQQLEKAIKKVISSDTALSLNVEELKRTDVSAQVVAQNMAWDLEKRMRHRRVMKRHIDIIMQNKEAQGAKVMLAGRLNGAEIARTEHLEEGKLPLTTIRANIDFGKAIAFTKYGTIGVKVWIYKGEIFEKEDKQTRV